MNKATLIKATLLLSAAASGVATGANVNLQVKGIIQPSACIPNLQGGGAIDYPDVSYRSLSQTEVTKLPLTEVALNITCDAPTKVGIRTVDNRSASRAVLPNVQEPLAMYGLGTVGQNKTNIGAFYMSIRKVETGSGTPDLLSRGRQANAPWVKNTTGAIRTDQTISWGVTGTTTAGTFQRITATLGISPVLNKASLLPANEIINLDGAATIEMVYL
jgi:type 1 fimbria pilin